MVNKQLSINNKQLSINKLTESLLIIMINVKVILEFEYSFLSVG